VDQLKQARLFYSSFVGMVVGFKQAKESHDAAGESDRLLINEAAVNEPIHAGQDEYDPHSIENSRRKKKSIVAKISNARKKAHVPSAAIGFGLGVKFGFVLLLFCVCAIPRERFDQVRATLGEYLPIPVAVSERVIAPESEYKRVHGTVAKLGSAKPFDPNAFSHESKKSSSATTAKYPRKDLTPPSVKKKKLEEAKKMEEEEEAEKKMKAKEAKIKEKKKREEEEKSVGDEKESSKKKKSSSSAEEEDNEKKEEQEPSSSSQSHSESESSSSMGKREEEEDEREMKHTYSGKKDDWFNGPAPIPHLIDHLEAHDIKPSDRDLRILTIANHAYWPLAEIMLDSAKRHAPEIANRLTFILSDEKSVKACKDRVSKSCQHTCFYDHEMEDILGKYTDDEGSYKAAYDTNTGVKLRQLWTWRKVKAVKTLIDGGYAAMFVDASTVFLRDMREDVLHELFDHEAALVTLSDFGGATEQHSTNTGLIAATPANKDAARILRTWMKREDPEDKDNTEQGVLTWEIAPKERANGVIIKALTQAQAPNFVTYDFKEHLGGNGNANDSKLGEDEDGKTDKKPKQHVAGLLHAAYCGCVEAKESFMSRVYAESKMALEELGGRGLKPEKIEEKDCDVFDRKKFLNTGRAPWD